MFKKLTVNKTAYGTLETATAIVCILILVAEGGAAEGDMLWYRTYGGTQVETPFALVPTNDGGWMVGAETNSFGAGFDDVWLIRLDANGDSLWSRTYGDIYNQYAHALVPATNGGWFLVANQYTFGPPTWLNAEVFRISETGDTLWTWLFEGSSEDELIAALPCADGFLAAGQIMFLGTGDFDQWLIRFNDAGDTLWTRTWGGQGQEQTTHLLPTAEGGSLVIGWTTSFSPQGGTEVSLWRNNDQGDSLWTRIYNDGNVNVVIDAAPTPDGGWLLSMLTLNHFGLSWDDVWLLRVDENGDEVWSKFYGGSSNDYILKILPLEQEGWLLAGTIADTGNVDTWLMKLDANGDSVWSRHYGTPMNEWIVSAILTPDSGCLLAGSVYYPPTENSDWWILKTDAGGDSQWSMTFGDSVLGDVARFLALTPDGNYLIAGESHVGAAGFTDVGVMCLEGPSTGIISAPSAQPTQFAMHKPHPNPFNASTVLSYQLPVASHVNLRVYDTAGRLVVTLVDGWRSAGEHEMTFDASHLPSGMYIYRLQAGGWTESGKMILLK